MQRYIDIVRDDSGNAVDSATVYVYEGDSMTLATLYDGNDVAVSQPLSTDSDGVIINESTDSSHKLGFKVAGGRYRIEVSKATESFTLPDLLIGTMSGQDTDNVAITGGTISGISDLALADGGTGASTVAGARTNLEVEVETRTAPQATTHDFTADADYTLTSTQEGYGRIILTDAGSPTVLTPGRNVIVSTTERRYIISNETAQTLTVKTSAGTGVAVPAGQDRIVYCDGTDVIELDDIPSASDTEAGLIETATQAEQGTGTATDKAVTSGRQHYHPSAAKAWVNFNGTGTIAIRDSYNVSSLTDNGTGNYDVNLSTGLSSVNGCAQANGAENAPISTSRSNVTQAVIETTTLVNVNIYDTAGAAQADMVYIQIAVFGDM